MKPFSAVLSHGTIYLVPIVLTFEFVDEILCCYHSNETSSAVLSRGTIYFSEFCKMKFGNLWGGCSSKYHTHLTPSRFPLLIVRASVIAPMKVTPTSASRAVACGGEKGAALSPSQNTSRLTSPPIFFFPPTLIFFTFFPPMRSLVRGYL